MGNTAVILQLLAFLSTAALLLALGVGAIVTRINGRDTLAGQLLIGATLLASAYGAVLIVVSLFSREQVLAVGTPKYFCEMDCHVTHAVIEAVKTDTVGGARAEGKFYLVKVRTWFDPSTTSPRRPKDAVVYPNPRMVWLVDGTGQRYAPSAAGMAALARSGQAGTPIDQPLLPDASYITKYAFDVPANTEQPRLWIANDEAMFRVMIGAERSPWHAKVLMALPGT